MGSQLWNDPLVISRSILDSTANVWNATLSYLFRSRGQNEVLIQNVLRQMSTQDAEAT
ncbi:unnamed protein product [Acidithrix sp. C25]|nr:unnamed protein product [Acidithrix sp. C25]